MSAPSRSPTPDARLVPYASTSVTGEFDELVHAGPGATASGRSAVVQDIKVLTTDDNRAVRDALADLVSATAGFVLVGHAHTGEEAIDAVEATAPDLVLMDVVMPGIGGPAATQAILTRRPNVAIVVISIDDPALDDAARTLGDMVAYARKQDLRPKHLKHLWESHGRR